MNAIWNQKGPTIESDGRSWPWAASANGLSGTGRARLIGDRASITYLLQHSEPRSKRSYFTLAFSGSVGLEVLAIYVRFQFRLGSQPRTNPFSSHQQAMEPTTIGTACVVVVGYLCIVRSLRWRQYNAVHAEYRSRFESNTLTPEDAQRIIHVGAYYDMPLLLNYSLAFALFKTYGIVRLLSHLLFL